MLVAGVLVVLGATLFPFRFQFRHVTWTQYMREFGVAPSSLLDFPRNVLLFFPFGVGLAAILQRRYESARTLAVVTTAIGVVATWSVESLQVFQPDRTANFSDVVANTLGTAVGFTCWRAWKHDPYLLSTRAKLRPGPVIIGSGIYVLVAVAFTLSFMQGFRPGGWDGSYRLAVGNELTGDRPWRGSLSEFILLDRAVDSKRAAELLTLRTPSGLLPSVLAHYRDDGSGGMADATGQLPHLLPLTRVRVGTNGQHAVPPGAWLVSERPVPSVAQRINASGEFTLAALVLSSDTTQKGPARIITISRDPHHRNLTVGQEGTALAVRWRSPLKGENGATPELQFPGVFATLQPRRVLVTSDGIHVRIYTDARSEVGACFLGPEVALMAIFYDGEYWPLVVWTRTFWSAALIYAGVLFVPLGAVIGWAATFFKGLRVRLALVFSGVVLPPILVEAAVAGFSGGRVRTPIIALGGTCGVLAAVAIMHVRQGQLLSKPG